MEHSKFKNTLLSGIICFNLSAISCIASDTVEMAKEKIRVLNQIEAFTSLEETRCKRSIDIKQKSLNLVDIEYNTVTSFSSTETQGYWSVKSREGGCAHTSKATHTLESAQYLFELLKKMTIKSSVPEILVYDHILTEIKNRTVSSEVTVEAFRMISDVLKHHKDYLEHTLEFNQHSAPEVLLNFKFMNKIGNKPAILWTITWNQAVLVLRALTQHPDFVDLKDHLLLAEEYQRLYATHPMDLLK